MLEGTVWYIRYGDAERTKDCLFAWSERTPPGGNPAPLDVPTCVSTLFSRTLGTNLWVMFLREKASWDQKILYKMKQRAAAHSWIFNLSRKLCELLFLTWKRWLAIGTYRLNSTIIWNKSLRLNLQHLSHFPRILRKMQMQCQIIWFEHTWSQRSWKFPIESV